MCLTKSASYLHNPSYPLHHSSTPNTNPLERPIFIRTGIPLPATPTPNITNLLRPTSLSTTILRHNTTLRLQQIIRLHQRLIRQHRIRYIIPESRIEGRRLGPSTVYVICGAGIILEFPDWTGPGEGFGDVGKVGLDAHYFERFGVDLIELVASIVPG